MGFRGEGGAVLKFMLWGARSWGSLRLWVLGGLMIWSLGRSAANLLGLKGGVGSYRYRSLIEGLYTL